MNRLLRIVVMVGLATALVGGIAPQTWALGFRNPDQGARATGQGEAFVAQADDASAIHYNPAGLTQVDGAQFTSGGMIGLPSWEFSSAGGNAEMNTPYVLPHFYAASDFGTERWRFGLGVNVPFGNAADYGDGGPLRFSVTKAMLAVFNFAPTVAYRFNEHLSLGVGVNVYYGQTELSRHLLLAPPPFPEARFKFEGDGTTVGATIGLLWKINEQHAVGLVYRTPFEIDFEDSAVLKHSILGTTGPSPAEASIEFPQSVAVGYAFRPTQKLKLEVDIEWTNWDTLNNVVLRSPDLTFNGTAIPFHWRDSFFYEFGLQYDLAERWVVRAGYIFSENTVPDSTFSPSVPDSDRHVFSVGLGYHTERFTVDLVYQYSLSEDRTVTGSPDNNFDGVGDADGRWKTSAHSVMVTSTIRF